MRVALGLMDRRLAKRMQPYPFGPNVQAQRPNTPWRPRSRDDDHGRRRGRPSAAATEPRRRPHQGTDGGVHGPAQGDARGGRCPRPPPVCGPPLPVNASGHRQGADALLGRASGVPRAPPSERATETQLRLQTSQPLGARYGFGPTRRWQWGCSASRQRCSLAQHHPGRTEKSGEILAEVPGKRRRLLVRTRLRLQEESAGPSLAAPTPPPPACATRTRTMVMWRWTRRRSCACPWTTMIVARKSLCRPRSIDGGMSHPLIGAVPTTLDAQGR